jgi:hypothetical protein
VSFVHVFEAVQIHNLPGQIVNRQGRNHDVPCAAESLNRTVSPADRSIMPQSREAEIWNEGDLAAEERRGSVDSALGRIRHGWPGARSLAVGRLRRLLGWETLVVLSVFPLGAALSALVALIEATELGQSVPYAGIPSFVSPWQATLLAVAGQAIALAPAGLVAYLLCRSGEGLKSINLDRRRLRMDLALIVPIWLIVQRIPQSLGAHIVIWSHLTGFHLLPSPVPLANLDITLVQAAAAIAAGVVEEIVVLGYLVRRLEQRGYGVARIVTIAVMVRASYHIYYGWNIIPILLWATASVLVYLRVRRLLPFIICHIIWDISIPLRAFYPNIYRPAEVIVSITAVVLAAKWLSWTPTQWLKSLRPPGGSEMEILDTPTI